MEDLKFNICNLPSSFICDTDVPGLDRRIEENIGGALKYSCQFWSYHFILGEIQEGIIQKLEVLLREKGIYWIEVMSILGLLSDSGAIAEAMLMVSQA